MRKSMFDVQGLWDISGADLAAQMALDSGSGQCRGRVVSEAECLNTLADSLDNVQSLDALLAA